MPERAERCLRLAESLGARTLVLHPPRRLAWHTLSLNGRSWRLPRLSDRDPEGWLDWHGEGLERLQASTTVRICSENLMPTRYLGRRMETFWLADMATWPTAHRWLTLDTTHWGACGEDPLEAYRAAKKRVAHVHLSDYGPAEHQLPDTGHLNLRGLLRAMAADGYGGTELLHQAVALSEGDVGRRQLQRHRAAQAFARENLGSA